MTMRMRARRRDGACMGMHAVQRAQSTVRMQHATNAQGLTPGVPRDCWAAGWALGAGQAAGGRSGVFLGRPWASSGVGLGSLGAAGQPRVLRLGPASTSTCQPANKAQPGRQGRQRAASGADSIRQLCASSSLRFKCTYQPFPLSLSPRCSSRPSPLLLALSALPAASTLLSPEWVSPLM